MGTKACIRCGVKKPLGEFRLQKGREKARTICRSCDREYSKQWYQLNKERAAAYNRTQRRKRKMGVVEALGGKCVRCGFDNWKALQVDHINGGGYVEYQQGPHKVYKKILDGQTDEYQLLCANCNWIKRYELTK